MERLQELKSAMEVLESNMDSFYNKNNKAAAARARKALQTIVVAARTGRKEISARVNELKATK